MTMKSTFALCSLFLVALGCDWKADGPARLEARYVAPDVAGAELVIPDVDLGDVAGEGLGGRWAMRMTLAGTISPLAPVWDISVTNLFIVDVPDAVDRVAPIAARLTFCDQITLLDTGNGARPSAEVPLVLRDALASSPLALPLNPEGIAPGDVVWAWGVQDLDDPKTSPLPGDAEDARVWDEDGDGEPGVTLEILHPLAGQRQMIRRAIWTLAAGVLSDDVQTIRGTLGFQIDEVALSASLASLMTVAPISPGEGPHPYVLRRVGAAGDDGAYDCERLRADQLGLFEAEDAQDSER